MTKSGENITFKIDATMLEDVLKVMPIGKVSFRFTVNLQTISIRPGELMEKLHCLLIPMRM